MYGGMDPYRRRGRRRGLHGGQLLLDGIQLGLVSVGLGSHVRVLLEQSHVLLLGVGKEGRGEGRRELRPPRQEKKGER